MPTDAYISELTVYAGNFAIMNTAPCRGQLMPISQNTALFNLIGTTYGGDGTSTFGLPDLSTGGFPIGTGSQDYPGQSVSVGTNGPVPTVGVEYLIALGGVFPPRG